MRPISLVLLDLLYPPKCAFCEAVLKDSRQMVCPRCQAEISWLPEAERLQTGEHFTLCLSVSWYEHQFRFAMLQYKFHGQRHLAEVFAAPLSNYIQERFLHRYDLITWIPISNERLRTRGYNQSELLARAISERLGQPALPLLHHPRPKPPQSGIATAADRKANVSGCFALAPSPDLAGSRILLIDDVITTGSTLEEAAQVLRAGGAAEVLCATVCRTRPGALHL